MQRISLSMGDGRHFEKAEFALPDGFDAENVIKHWVGEELKKGEWGNHIFVQQSIATGTDIEWRSANGN